ncbi:hypothetical protein CDO52_11060 [Nocardiopsis gilva YIM 90087]|uniref:Uncharacterized protein n=1 Tax=Nocardiopsis gilva YIM 90087 TaxID=1235441 RepID=A0A223S543_9ACTN|nr:hypothetical protein [Nocardiopsis gilva]ASU83243.1 hypothetical protein CDO52_11060 [Nocardiopsis gilva YIM 90087]
MALSPMAASRPRLRPPVLFALVTVLGAALLLVSLCTAPPPIPDTASRVAIDASVPYGAEEGEPGGTSADAAPAQRGTLAVCATPLCD